MWSCNDLLEQREVETVGSEPEVSTGAKPALYRAVLTCWVSALAQDLRGLRRAENDPGYVK